MYQRMRSAALAALLCVFPLATELRAGGSLKDAPLPGTRVDWSGVYVGVHGGAGWSNVSTSIVDPPWLIDALAYTGLPSNSSVDVDGWLAGGHIGLQRQFRQLVLGVEASFTGGRLEGSSSQTFAGELAAPNVNVAVFEGFSWVGNSHMSARINDIFMLAGRIGHARERWLAYLKAGYASAEVEVKGQGNVAFFDCFEGCILMSSIQTNVSSRERHHGAILGAGFEYMIKPNIILGLEYDYIDLQAKTHKIAGTFIVDDVVEPINGKIRVDPDAIHAVAARLSFKFGHEAARHAPLK